MNYIDIPILESASRCGLLRGVRTDKVEINRDCVFCSDKRKRLYINTEKNRFYCHNCGERGNSVSLYAKVMGIDNKTACKELTDGGFRKYQKPSQKQAAQESPERTIMDRHKVYTELLRLSELAYRHKDDLVSRGLSEAEIKKLMYKTVPVGLLSYQIARELAVKFDLKHIPGFFTKNGKWQMMQRNGLFIPMRDKDGYIQGLQIRMDDASKGKCKWFSSTYDENGINASAKWIHVTGWNGQTEVVLTEGGMKADISNYFTDGICFLGVPGVNCIEGIVPLLEQLDIKRLNIAYDMDWTVNRYVKKAMDTPRSMKKLLRGGLVMIMDNPEDNLKRRRKTYCLECMYCHKNKSHLSDDTIKIVIDGKKRSKRVKPQEMYCSHGDVFKINGNQVRWWGFSRNCPFNIYSLCGIQMCTPKIVCSGCLRNREY